MAGFEGVRRWRGDINLATLLSLELLLLAFFVLLTAISRFEGDRTRSVIDSVQTAFAGPLAGPLERDAAERPDAAALRTLQGEIGQLVRTAIPLTRVESTAFADVMRFDLPTDTFFQSGEASLRPARQTLLKRIVAALARRPAGYRYDLDVRLPGNSPRRLAVGRASTLVRALAAAGAPPASLSAGIEPGAADRIRFMIRLEATGRPANLFEELAGDDGS